MLFKCVGCGHCCKHIKGVNMGQVHGLTIMPHEVHLFPKELVKPMLRYSLSDHISPGKVFVYQLDVDVCPHYDKDVGCRIYLKRPQTCAAYPLEITIKGPILHGSCPEVEHIMKDGESSYRIPRSYIKAAMDVHKYYTDNLRITCVERFDLSLDQWRGILYGISQEDIAFLRR